MKYIYGPVKSRRLGLSLGLSLTPYKICSFDCIYCQLGKTTLKTTERKQYTDIDEVMSELKTFIQSQDLDIAKLSYITLAGFGEPILNDKIGDLINNIKKITSIPVAVLTNSSLFSREDTRQDLLGADLVMPTLCCAEQDDFERIARPSSDLKIKDIIDGLIKFRGEFKGKIWLEIMVVKGVNDSIAKVKKIKGLLDLFKPDRIFLNSPIRPPSEEFIEPADKRTLLRIKEFFGDKAEII